VHGYGTATGGKTGDTSSIGLWLGSASLSVIMMASVLVIYKKWVF